MKKIGVERETRGRDPIMLIMYREREKERERRERKRERVFLARPIAVLEALS